MPRTHAAKAIAVTGRPVGLLMWRGRHAWVMSGFRATADPKVTDDFRVTRAIVRGQSSTLRGKYVLVLPYEVDLSLWTAAR